ncbi:ATP-binding protein [Streptomyces sp. DW26H14]|uniref:ATP-binding protein n=1 Tax=Streptomyces sp. DW26H14 TaxID=3435395 RepID=UPI00403E051B
MIALLAVAVLLWRQRSQQRELRRQGQVNRDLGAQNTMLQGENRQLSAHQAEYVAAFEQRTEEAAHGAQERAAAALSTTVVALTRTLQSAAANQARLIEENMRRFGNNSEHLQEWLKTDSHNAQFRRKAQALEVLSGGRLPRRPEAASISDIARGAQSRIRHFNRVEIRMAGSDVAVVARAVEPVALVLAELLDNATEYSPPTSTVEVEIRDVPSGICVSIYDSGVGMTEDERKTAEALLSQPASLADLGTPPQIGFRLIGTLAARQSGFSVSLKGSPYGGVEAVVLLRKELLTEVPQAAPRPTTEGVEPTVTRTEGDLGEADQGNTPDTDADAAAYGVTHGGLPRRRRRRSEFSVVPGTSDERPNTGTSAPVANFGAFQRGSTAGRSTPISEGRDDQ